MAYSDGGGGGPVAAAVDEVRGGVECAEGGPGPEALGAACALVEAATAGATRGGGSRHRVAATAAAAFRVAWEVCRPLGGWGAMGVPGVPTDSLEPIFFAHAPQNSPEHQKQDTCDSYRHRCGARFPRI